MASNSPDRDAQPEAQEAEADIPPADGHLDGHEAEADIPPVDAQPDAQEALPDIPPVDAHIDGHEVEHEIEDVQLDAEAEPENAEEPQAERDFLPPVPVIVRKVPREPKLQLEELPADVKKSLGILGMGKKWRTSRRNKAVQKGMMG